MEISYRTYHTKSTDFYQSLTGKLLLRIFDSGVMKFEMDQSGFFQIRVDVEFSNFVVLKKNEGDEYT